jgi:hypothetical protein
MGYVTRFVLVALAGTMASGQSSNDALPLVPPLKVEELFTALSDADPVVQERAKRTLGEMTDPRIAERLIGIVKDKRAARKLRDSAIGALRWSQDPRAVEALATILQDARADSTLRCEAGATLGWSQDSRAVEALATSLQDQSLKIVRCAATAMAYEWNRLDERQRTRWRFTSVLLKAIESGRQGGKARSAVLAGAYWFFIAKGIPLTEYMLATAIERHGDLRMAMDFLNSGSPELERAGRRWISRHVLSEYRIIEKKRDSQDSGRVRWGSNNAGEIILR